MMPLTTYVKSAGTEAGARTALAATDWDEGKRKQTSARSDSEVGVGRLTRMGHALTTHSQPTSDSPHLLYLNCLLST